MNSSQTFIRHVEGEPSTREKSGGFSISGCRDASVGAGGSPGFCGSSETPPLILGRSFPGEARFKSPLPEPSSVCICFLEKNLMAVGKEWLTVAGSGTG